MPQIKTLFLAEAHKINLLGFLNKLFLPAKIDNRSQAQCHQQGHQHNDDGRGRAMPAPQIQEKQSKQNQPPCRNQEPAPRAGKSHGDEHTHR
jgi:hypothetical protein